MHGSTSGTLRDALNARALALAKAEGLLHAVTFGESPSVIFGCDDAGRHGNFHPAAYRQIRAQPDWAARLQKVHTAWRRMAIHSDWRWRELDCACSSDALLMNIFCHPDVLRSAEVCGLLGIARGERPVFGYKPGVPLLHGRLDRTEVDMAIGQVLFEAKLTEGDFQAAPASKLLRYRDLDVVFDWTRDEHGTILHADVGPCRSYQVFRGILAAHATEKSFCLLSDARRPDLMERWYGVLRMVRCAELRCRIKLVTWQELCCYLPKNLQHFLETKYGIVYGTGWFRAAISGD